MKKKLTVPLLVLVLLLWGVIFYRIFSGRGDQGDSMQLPATVPAKGAVAERTVSDSLLLNYRDPFLEQVGDLLAVTEDAAVIEEHEYVEEVPYIDWSQLQYFGLVDGGSKDKTVALVSIGGREYMMKPGETVGGYTLVGAVGSSIVLSYQGQTGTITLQGK